MFLLHRRPLPLLVAIKKITVLPKLFSLHLQLAQWAVGKDQRSKEHEHLLEDAVDRRFLDMSPCQCIPAGEPLSQKVSNATPHLSKRLFP